MENVADCMFCDIAQKTDKSILKANNKFVVIKDIKPHAKHHYLVISKTHISKITDVKASDIELIKSMESLGRAYLRAILKDEGEADIVEDMLRVGFHQPPMVSVKHLHMHILYPINSMGLINRHIVFRPGRFFKSATDVMVEMEKNLLQEDNNTNIAKETKKEHEAKASPQELRDCIANNQ
uniref:HIT domain-containing protein n=1 Tax=Rhabditophanes sp. KR3021 TaxID=114890 RepID=A0AC35UGA8_9BILA